MKRPFTRVVCTRPFFFENDYLRLRNLNNVLRVRKRGVRKTEQCLEALPSWSACPLELKRTGRGFSRYGANSSHVVPCVDRDFANEVVLFG